jgi:AcrR family transcriptional regulator
VTTGERLGRVPRQSRAKATVARLQDAAREILVEAGAAGLNTNLIAERAGVNIATLYRYYPDKYAILLHVFEQFETERREYVLGRIGELQAGTPWRSWTRSVIDHLAGVREAAPSAVALRRAMATSPDLVEVDHRSGELIAERLGEAFVRAFPHLADDTARAVAHLMVDVITVGLDSAFSVTPPDRLRIAELQTMVEAYLARHLDR